MAKSRGGVWCMHCPGKAMIPAGVPIVRFAGGIWRRDHYETWKAGRAGVADGAQRAPAGRP